MRRTLKWDQEEEEGTNLTLMHMVERVFDFKEILEEKKLNLLLLSLWSMHLSGGLICVTRKLEKKRENQNLEEDEVQA